MISEGRKKKPYALRLACGCIVALATVLVSTPAHAVPITVVGETEAAPSASSDSPADDGSGGTYFTVEGPETPSAIPVPVDKETERFRQELAARQARLREFEAQLDALDRELEVAQEAYNDAADKLAFTKSRLQATEEDLAKARTAYEIQLELLDSRAESIYRGGQFAVIDLLLDARSVSDLIARFKFLNTLGMRDADIAEHFAAQRDQLEQAAVQLRAQNSQAEALEFDLKAREIEVLLRIQERQEMLASAQTDILELLRAEASRRQIEQAELLEEILSGADKAGITIAAGSPVETALAYHGIPYLWGGATPAGFDCSGLVLYVFRQHGVELPHYSGSQFLLGDKVASSALVPGDVVFFGSPVHHVGIYIGGGYFIHAPKTGDFVKISLLADRLDYAGARRFDWQQRVGPIAGTTGATASAIASAAVTADPVQSP